MNRFLTSALCFCLVALALPAMAGTFKTITIDGSYSDWDDVPALVTDGGDNTAGPDIDVVKITNDEDFLYIYSSYTNGLSLGTFTTIDTDSNLATGNDNFAGGVLTGIGSEAAWQNDFPFTQEAGVFNNGSGMSGDFFGSGAALLTPFANGNEREIAISLDITFNSDGSPVFDDAFFDIVLWTDLGLGPDGTPLGDNNGDMTPAISYELATNVPEPLSLSLLSISLVGFATMRRR